MENIAICTIYAKRKSHLQNLVTGLIQSNVYPQELAIACMNDCLPDLPKTPFPIRTIQLSTENNILPLAKARNAAASITTAERLIFLDLDCICNPDLVATFNYFLNQEDALFQGSVRYLDSNWSRYHWTQESLWQQSSFNSLQGEVLTGKQKIIHPYELFWSLCFGISKKTFFSLGGFDEYYLGYGGEDTDFSFTARQQQLPIYKISALAYHQFHPSYSPPLNHLAEIVSNAQVFFQKWQVMPMEKWLQQFSDLGYLEMNREQIKIIKYPTADEISACLKQL